MTFQVWFIASGARHWRCHHPHRSSRHCLGFQQLSEGLWWSIVLPVGSRPCSAEVDTEERERCELIFSPAQQQKNVPGTRESFFSCCMEKTGRQVGWQLLVQQLWQLGVCKVSPPQLNTVTLLEEIQCDSLIGMNVELGERLVAQGINFNNEK